MRAENEIEKLKKTDSYSFLGSALALSCYFLVVQENPDMAEDFLRLSVSDALLYQNQVEGGTLSEKEMADCRSDYRTAILDLEDLEARRTPDGFHQLVSVNLSTAKSLYNLSFREPETEPEAVILNKRRYLFEYDEKTRRKCAYPLLLVFLKLMERKNRGKKPFSFEVEQRALVIRLQNAVKKQDFGNDLLKEAGKLAELCVPQIKMESLKEDFRYLSKAFQILGKE